MANAQILLVQRRIPVRFFKRYYSWRQTIKQDIFLRNDTLVEVEVDPLKDKRITISGGMLIINDPKQEKDRGKYFCKAKNKFGVIR